MTVVSKNQKIEVKEALRSSLLSDPKFMERIAKEKKEQNPKVKKTFSTFNKNAQEALFKLSFSSSKTYGAGIRLPLNVAFVIDKSGSMYSGDRAESLKRSLWEIANSLTNKDNVSLILFDNEAVSVYEGSNMHLKGFENVIKNYAPGGGTNRGGEYRARRVGRGRKADADGVQQDRPRHQSRLGQAFYHRQRNTVSLALVQSGGDVPAAGC